MYSLLNLLLLSGYLFCDHCHSGRHMLIGWSFRYLLNLQCRGFFNWRRKFVWLFLLRLLYLFSGVNHICILFDELECLSVQIIVRLTNLSYEEIDVRLLFAVHHGRLLGYVFYDNWSGFIWEFGNRLSRFGLLGFLVTLGGGLLLDWFVFCLFGCRFGPSRLAARCIGFGLFIWLLS